MVVKAKVRIISKLHLSGKLEPGMRSTSRDLLKAIVR